MLSLSKQLVSVPDKTAEISNLVVENKLSLDDDSLVKLMSIFSHHFSSFETQVVDNKGYLNGILDD